MGEFLADLSVEKQKLLVLGNTPNFISNQKKKYGNKNTT